MESKTFNFCNNSGETNNFFNFVDNDIINMEFIIVNINNISNGVKMTS